MPGQEACESIPITMGRYVATIRAAVPVADTLRPMLRDLVRADSDPAGATVDVRQDDGDFRISVDGRLWEPGPDQTLCDQLIYVLMRASLDAERELLHLHAAYVALDGLGLLLAGNRGSGKSTLVARLVTAGFDYLTDERVGLDPSLRVSALLKPVSLVSASFSLLSHLDPARTRAGAASPRLWHVPASAIRPGSVVATASPAVVAFVGYRPGPSVESSEMHPAEAARLLLSDSVDAARFGPRALPLAARFCASVRCVRIYFGDSDEVPDAFRSLLVGCETARPSVEIRNLRPPRGHRGRATPRSGTRAPAMSKDVSGVVVGDRALVYRKSTGEVIELDDTSTAWLQLLDGRTSPSALAREVAAANDLSTDTVVQVANAVIDKLEGLGVIG